MADFIFLFDSALRTLCAVGPAQRPYPAAPHSAPALTAAEAETSTALMRVDHAGEICAQGLYQGQALSTPDPVLRQNFLKAAQEEHEHLLWTAHRLQELGARPSLLTPLWYGGALALGLFAGRLPRPYSLGFVTETERQVEAHLDEHLERLPESDQRSRAILLQMQEDERRHGANAEAAGGQPVPAPLRLAMKMLGKIMTRTAEKI